MKKFFAILGIFLLVAGFASAQNIKEDREIKTLEVPQDGRAKIGILLGYPSGITFGYRPSNWVELNLSAGYNFSFAQSAIISANGLFTLVNIPIGDSGLMPLSLGPQVNFIVGSQFYLEAVADLRLEYTFDDVPLNLFIEAGFGVRFFHVQPLEFAWNGGLGIRYVF